MLAAPDTDRESLSSRSESSGVSGKMAEWSAAPSPEICSRDRMWSDIFRRMLEASSGSFVSFGVRFLKQYRPDREPSLAGWCPAHPTVKERVLGNFLNLVFLGELEREAPVSEMLSSEVEEAPRSQLLFVTVGDSE